MGCDPGIGGSRAGLRPHGRRRHSIRPSAEAPLFAEGFDSEAKNRLLDPDLGTTAVPIPARECLIRRLPGGNPFESDRSLRTTWEAATACRTLRLRERRTPWGRGGGRGPPARPRECDDWRSGHGENKVRPVAGVPLRPPTASRRSPASTALRTPSRRCPSPRTPWCGARNSPRPRGVSWDPAAPSRG